jgi:hypothetical protein
LYLLVLPCSSLFHGVWLPPACSKCPATPTKLHSHDWPFPNVLVVAKIHLCPLQGPLIRFSFQVMCCRVSLPFVPKCPSLANP